MKKKENNSSLEHIESRFARSENKSFDIYLEITCGNFILNKIIASVKSNILNAEVVVLESNNKESEAKGLNLNFIKLSIA